MQGTQSEELHSRCLILKAGLHFFRPLAATQVSWVMTLGSEMASAARIVVIQSRCKESSTFVAVASSSELEQIFCPLCSESSNTLFRVAMTTLNADPCTPALPCSKWLDPQQPLFHCQGSHCPTGQGGVCQEGHGVPEEPEAGKGVLP